MIPAGSYLLFGRTGVGKSSIVNTVAQASLAPVDNTHSCTKGIETYVFNTPDGRYEIYDSPGLCEDDTSMTDERYVAALDAFLSDADMQGLDITIVLVVRSENQRIRSEDHDVTKYLAKLLSCHPKTPVIFIATWANFFDGRERNGRALNQLRVQYLLMLDKELLIASNKELCMQGFSGSYAVNNSLGVWLASWNSCCIESTPRDSYLYLENIVGHPIAFISEWIESTGHDPVQVLQRCQFNLINGRILNLTQYPLIEGETTPDLLSVSSESLAYYEISGDRPSVFRIESSLLASEIDSADKLIRGLFRIRSTLDAKALSRELTKELDCCIEYLQSLPLSQELGPANSRHIVVLLAAREVISGLHYIAKKRSMFMLSHSVITERIAIIAQILRNLFEKNIDSFLSKEVIELVELTLVLSVDDGFKLVTQHLLSSSAILYLAVAFAEFACFPRNGNNTYGDLKILDLAPLVDWLHEECRLEGYSRMMLDHLKIFEWPRLSRLAVEHPQCMRALLDDILAVMRKNQWLVPANETGLLYAKRRRGEALLEDPSYWPFWRDEGGENQTFPLRRW